MGLSNELSCEAGSFSHHHNPHSCFQSEALRLYFPVPEPWVVCSIWLPSCSSQFILTQMWDHPLCQRLPHPVCKPPPHSSPPATALLQVLSTWLPVTAPPTSVDECFLFNSLVVRLPYSSIFWQFWLFFVFKFVVVLLLVVQGGTVCLPTPPSWLGLPHTF